MGIIRVFLAISVVLFHSGSMIFGVRLIDGFSAVALFFIISGFYMALILNGKYHSYSAFMKNRLLKLYPIYWVVLALAFLSSPSQPFAGLSGPAFLYYLFSNFLVIGSHLTSIIVHTDGGLGVLPFGRAITGPEMTWHHLYIGPVWSISVEILFYAIAPFLLTARFRYIKLGLMFLVSAVAYLYLSSQASAFIPWTYNFLAPTIYLFALGAIAWNFYRSNFFHKLYHPSLGILAFLIIISYIIFHAHYITGIGFSLFGGAELANLFGAAIFSLCVPFVFELTSKSNLDRSIGELSYPIYLSHMLVLQHSPWAAGANPLLVTIGLSMLLNYFVMRPIEKFRMKMVR